MGFLQVENRGILAHVIVYIFCHLHETMRTEENLLGIDIDSRQLKS